MVKAISLFSGGLDSVLAVCVIRDQNIDVAGLTFETPFFTSGKARISAEAINLPLTVMDITEEHLEILKNPLHGYGRNLNPCIDCHGLMLKFAGRIMEQTGADFIFTGEVLGERPMSQNKEALKLVAKLSGYPQYVLRPLSAKLLPVTKPERDNKVDRLRLLDINGKSRKRQMELAQIYNITRYESPSGGCLLTYEGYCAKLKDLLDQPENVSLREYHLLKIGRHFRLPAGNKLIVGKNQEDNKKLSGLCTVSDIILVPVDAKGPTGLITDAKNGDDTDIAAKIIARYCKNSANVDILIKWGVTGLEDVITVTGLDPEQSRRLML